MTFKLTQKQDEALSLLGTDATHILLSGGSRSGKTFLILRQIAIRAIVAPHSRHAVLRFRFNHVKASVVHDTWPKMMQLCFPQVEYKLDKTDWFAQFQNGSQVWFGGLDDKERTEKILGQEYVSIFLNECSQIPFHSRNLAITRLAQSCINTVTGVPVSRKMYYDCNPPSQAHWSYKLFIQGRNPDTGGSLPDEDKRQYAYLQMNPLDNLDNLPEDYLKTLDSLPARMRLRFKEGKFADITENSLFSLEVIEKWRNLELPDMQRIVISVDPSGASDIDNTDNDDIGITVCSLGTDGNGYLLEDLTVKAGPHVWGNIATTAFDRHGADLIVGETNYGGEMVKFVVQTSKPKVPFKKVTASRGKVVRAEPISSLFEDGKIRFAGYFPELEDELCSFTTKGYIGIGSPNRADAFIWGMSELFPKIIKEDIPNRIKRPIHANSLYRPHRMHERL